MTSQNIAKVIRWFAISIIFVYVIFALIVLTMFFTDYSLPDSWQYHDTYYVINVSGFVTAVGLGIFIAACVALLSSNRIAKYLCKFCS